MNYRFIGTAMALYMNKVLIAKRSEEIESERTHKIADLL